LNYSRLDFAQIGPTCPRTARVLPLGKHKAQKYVVGDQDGVVSCLYYKKGECLTSWKTEGLGTEIRSLVLSGTAGDENDRVFYTSGSIVRGLNKKGKEFLKFDTNITESLSSLYVLDSRIWLGGQYTYNQFLDCKDKYFYMSPDKINHLIAASVGSKELDAVLACQDGIIRVIHGSDLVQEVNVGSAVMCLDPYLSREQGPGGGNSLIWGTAAGHVGCHAFSKEGAMKIWDVSQSSISSDPDVGTTNEIGSILCLHSVDVTQDGVADIIVGRDSGSVEIWGFDISTTEPVLQYCDVIHESITSVTSGKVLSPANTDIMVSTFSGRVIALTPAISAVQGASGKNSGSVSDLEKMKLLRKELTELTKNVEAQKEKNKNQTNTKTANEEHASSTAAAGLANPAGRYNGSVSAPFSQGISLRLSAHFVFQASRKAYQLSVESAAPIDYCLLWSDIPLTMLDGSSNTAVVTEVPADSSASAVSSYVYRCTERSTRLDMTVSTQEGQAGTVNIVTISATEPRSGERKSFKIVPLSLHSRVEGFNIENLPYSSISFSGSLSMSEMQSLMVGLVPNLPEKVTEDNVVLYLQNARINTHLYVQYRKGEATFKTTSLSTLRVCRDYLNSVMTAKGKKAAVTFNVNEKSVPYVISLLDERLQYSSSLTNRVFVMDALKEVVQQENTSDFLPHIYADALNEETKLRAELAAAPSLLAELRQVVVDLFLDFNKLKGVNVSARLPDLRDLLQNFEAKAVTEFLMS